MTGVLRRRTTLIGLALLLTAGAAPVASAAGDTGAAPAGNGCSGAGYPNRVRVTFTDDVAYAFGQQLIVCATSGYDGVRIDNQSSNVLWTVDNPAFPYWSEDQDHGRPATTQLFRAEVRQLTGAPTGILTVEPGTAARLRTGPAGLHLTLYADLQALWASTKLVVDKVRIRAGESLVRVLRRNSPTRAVVVACAIDGYNAGKQLTAADGDPSQTLAAALGLLQGAAGSGCVTEVNNLEDTLKHPRVTLASLTEAAKPEGRWASLMQEPLTAAAHRIGAHL